MVMMNKTSKPEAADPVYVAIGRTLDTSKGSVAFSWLEKGVVGVACNMDYTTPDEETSLNSAAEAKDGSPVASGLGEELFRIMAAPALEQGWITPEGLECAIQGLYGGGR